MHKPIYNTLKILPVTALHVLRCMLKPFQVELKTEPVRKKLCTQVVAAKRAKKVILNAAVLYN